MGVEIDAANYVEHARDIWRTLAKKHGLALTVVTDPTIDAAGLASRDRSPKAAKTQTIMLEREAPGAGASSLSGRQGASCNAQHIV
jgi:hypothetical protein